MAGRLSEFGFNLPEGADVLGNELIASKEDQNIDLINDETFGNCDNDWDFEQGGSVFFDEDPRYTKEDEPVEFFMEKSISRLVVDDDEVIDPAILDSRTRPKAIPHHLQNLDDLFGPASPPSLLDAEELVSPDHHNIWHHNKNSPITQHPLLANQIRPHQPFDDPSIVTAGKTISIGFNQSAPSLPGLQSPFPMTPGVGGPRPFTLEEVERHIRSQSPTPLQQNGRCSPVIPQNSRALPPHYRSSMPPGISPYGRVSPSIGVLPRPAQAPVGTPPRTGSRVAPSVGSVLNQRMMTPRPAGYPMQRGGYPVMVNPNHPAASAGPDGPFTPGPGPGYMMHTPIGQRPPPHAPYTDPGMMRRPDGRGIPHPAYRMSGPPPRMGPDFDRRYPDPRDNRQMNQSAYSDRSRDYGDQSSYRDRSRDYTDRPRDHHSFTRGSVSRDDIPDNPESLMTQKEKDWVIKIQMLQLQTDNPYIDDYYFMQFKMKQLAAERKKQKVGVQAQDDTPKLLLPQLTNFEVRNYTPAQFEGSLGKLTSSSVHNPRPVIDCRINVTHSDEGNLKGTKYKQVLVFIEKLYDVLLDVDDLEKRMLASAEDCHPKFIEERRHKLDGFYLSLECDNPTSLKFTSLMCIRKGKQLVNRIVPLFTQDQGMKVVECVCKQLPVIIRKDVADEILPSLYPAISVIIHQASLSELITLGDNLLSAAVPTSQTNPLLTAIQNKFGLSMVCCMVQRCEHIHVNDPLEIDNDSRDKWSQFLSTLTDKLTQANERSLPLPKPLDKFDKLTTHLERSLDRKTVLCVDEILKMWT